ncbi:MAG TPA: hypothetical protein VNN73_23400 [Blastocatellia bacterium]|nr:hypothetical protein [Blastocatellia bacterium]
MIIQYAMVLIFTTLSSAGLTVVARRVANKIGYVAAPSDNRWHAKATPLLGGAAIYLSFMLSYLVFAPKKASILPLLAAGSIMFVAGLIDDRYHIKPYTKLIIQLVAATTLVYFGFHLPWVEYTWVNDVLTIFWLVGITNAVNLLDNMDGLAGGISLIACLFLTVVFFLNGQTTEALLPMALAGAALGFLFFNFKPASIFMGDSGSLFLGFMLSGLALLSETARFSNLTSVLLTPVLIFLIPIFDTCIVTVTRKMSGRPVSQGGRDHTSHRLVALGVSERRAVLTFYVFALASGMVGLSLRWLKGPVVAALVPGFALVVLAAGFYLGKVRVYREEEEPKGVPIFNAIFDFTYKRRIFEVLLDVVLIALAYYGAYLLRWDGEMGDEQLGIFLKTLPVMIIVEISFLLFGGVYRGLWRYAGIEDLLRIVRSVFAGATMSIIVVFLMYRFHGPSRVVFLLNLLLLLILISASRLSFRMLKAVMLGPAQAHPDARPVLIYGAGDGGELLIREILNNPLHLYAPVGFIDDDERKAGRVLHGYPIFANHELPDLVRFYNIKDVIVSNRAVPAARLDFLRALGLSLKKVSVRIE